MAEWLDKQIVYQGSIIALQRKHVRFNRGAFVPFDVVERHGGVDAAPETDDPVSWAAGGGRRARGCSLSFFHAQSRS